MPYSIRWEPRGVIFTLHGVVSDDDLRSSTLASYRDERFADIEYQLVDFSRAERIAVSADGVRAVAALDRDAPVRAPQPRVAVVSGEMVVRGLTRLYELHAAGERWLVRSFPSEAEARAWLGRPCDDSLAEGA